MPDAKPIIVYQQASKPFVIFVALLSGIFGVMCLGSFFNRLSRLGGDEFFLLALGIAMLAFTYFFLRFMFLPTFILDDRRMVIRRFFGTNSFRFDEIQSIEVYTLWVRPRDSFGRRIHHRAPVETRQMIFRTRDGKERQATLPSFGRNLELLAEIGRRSGKTIGELPEQTK